MERADRELRREVDATIACSARLAGPWLKCGAGCSHCCVGPFAITPLDAERLRWGLRELQRTDPQRAAAVTARVLSAVVLMREQFPGDPATGALVEDESAEDRFCEQFRMTPCPVLDPQTGRCDLYDSRPISCRTCGPPVRFGEHKVAACHLCFVGASEDEVDRCRVEPDPQGKEFELLTLIEERTGRKSATIVAFALLPDH